MAFRVKRNVNKGMFSEWQYYNINPLALETPSNAQLSSTGVLSWRNAKYLDIATQKTVPSYILDFTISGQLIDFKGNSFTLSGNKSDTNSFDIRSYLVSFIIFDEEEEAWSDVALKVRIKSLNYYYYGGIQTSSGYEFLYKAYDESDYYETTIIIGKNLYNSLKG